MTRVKYIAILLLVGGMVWAQEGVKFGLRVDPLIGFFSLDSAGKTVRNLSGSGAFNFRGGLMLSFGFSDNAALLLGAGIGSYSAKVEYKPGYGIIGKTPSGADTTITLVATGLTSAVTPSYGITTLNVPVWLKLRTNPLGSTPIRAKALLGGLLDVKLGSVTKSDKVIVSRDFIDQDKTRGGSYVMPFLAQASAGAGVDIELEGIGTIDFAITYNHGLINFFNKDFKFDYTDANGVKITDIKPHKDLKGRLSGLGFNLMFWF
jgi:hypothetical protein